MKQDFSLYLRETNKCYELLKENGEFELLSIGQLLYEIATINLVPVVDAIRNFGNYEPNQRNYNVSSIVNAIIGSVCFAYTEIQLRLLRTTLDKHICKFRPSSFDSVATYICSEQEKIIKYYNLLKSVPIDADAIYNYFLTVETISDLDAYDCDYYDYTDYKELTENFAFIDTKSILYVKRDTSENTVVVDELIEIGHWECILEVELKNICKHLEEYKLSGCSISILDWLRQTNNKSNAMNFF